MKVSILIVTHLKDKSWLDWCLRSIDKFASGFHQVVVVCPRDELNRFSDLAGRNGAIWTPFDQAPPPLGQLHHQVQKCMADQYCQDSDFIMHVDSDCVFVEPVKPEDYFVNDRPVLLYKPYAAIKDFNPWRAPTEKALGFLCPNETMQRHPAVHYRYTYRDVRDRVSEVHGVPFERYVLSCKPEFPQGFTEFNTLGSFAMRNYPNAYHLINTAENGHPHSKLVQFWSHAQPEAPQDVWHEGKLEKNMIPADFIRKILA